MRLSLVPRVPRGFLNRTWGGREAQVTAAGVGGAEAQRVQQRLPGGGLEGSPGPDHQSWKKKTCGFRCENNESLKRTLEAQVTGLSWRSERALDSSVGDSGLTPLKRRAHPQQQSPGHEHPLLSRPFLYLSLLVRKESRSEPAALPRCRFCETVRFPDPGRKLAGRPAPHSESSYLLEARGGRERTPALQGSGGAKIIKQVCLQLFLLQKRLSPSEGEDP